MEKTVAGSAADVVRMQKEAQMLKTEKLIDDMKEDFPGLKGLWEAVKGELHDICKT